MKHGIIKLSILIVAIFSFTFIIYAGSPKGEPYGDPHAVRGGILNLQTSQFPKSFNSFTTVTTDTLTVFGLVYEPLLELHPVTLEYQPLIAKKWTMSDDKRIFTFKIDPRAKWADGKPITATDVKFTYDTIMNPKNLTSVQRLYYSRFNEPEIIDQYTVKISARTVHFKNLEALAGLNILPKHLFEGKDFNKAFNMSLPPGSGPYILSEVKEGRYFVLTRRKNYWADQLLSHRGTYNFQKIKFKVMDTNVAFEAFKKGEFDIYDEIPAKRWVTESNTKQFQKNWLVKQKIFNYAPRGFVGLAMNMRRPIFQDVRVRQALCYLIDRKTLIKKLVFSQSQPYTSYWPSSYGVKEEANPMIEYNPEGAKKLLQELGYTRLDKDGYRMDKNGKRLEFTILYYSNNWEKYLTPYLDSCKQVGVKVNLEMLSWATLLKRQDEYNFDMVLVGWAGQLFEDPEQLWYSKHADEIGSSNIPGYKSAEVDRLIDSLSPIFDPAKRTEIIKKIDRIIYRDYPYVLLWGNDYAKIFYKNVFGKPKTIFSKYTGDSSNTADIISYWWYDSIKAKRYQEAVAKNKPLPAEPVEIYYDKIAAGK